MTRFKISSDPYRKLLKYQIWDFHEEKWYDYSRINHSSSELFNEKFEHVFFPFKAKEILDILVRDFCGIIENEKLELVFQGTEDEYTELVQLCEDEPYHSRIVLSRDEMYLNNASDILPKIVDVFKNVSELVEKTNCEDKVREKSRKFAEATSEQIPICVVGNVSSGKSTFINALIGREILPSNANPVTGRVFRIADSSNKEAASISFNCDNHLVDVEICSQHYSIKGLSVDDDLYLQLTEVLNNTGDSSLQLQIKRVISILNNADYERIEGVIAVNVPFGPGILSESAYSFVIFDTPGSNSNSNEKHTSVLIEALNGFSNGIPVFVSRLEALDSNDNIELVKKLKEVNDFDKRFALIVVNKADSEQLPDVSLGLEKEKEILNQGLPKKLYAEGIFFVSSIMALGAKSGGNLQDKYYKEVFEEKKERYENPSSDSYKQLYLYNIMPQQLKKRAEQVSLACDDVIYANSGLYWVEQELETFAKKYAPYNKSNQAKSFIDGVITDTQTEISDQKEECDRRLSEMKKQYDSEKKALVEELSSNEKDLLLSGYGAYAEEMNSAKKAANTDCKIEKMKEHWDFFHEINNKEKDIDKLTQSLEEARETLTGNLLKLNENTKNLARYNEAYAALEEAKKASNRETSLNVLDKVQSRFKRKAESGQQLLVGKSRQYWDSVAGKMRDELVRIVLESDALEDEQRKELAGIIINYKEVPIYTDAEKVFENHDAFDKGIKALNIIFNKSLNDLNYKKIKRTYEKEMKDLVAELLSKGTAIETNVVRDDIRNRLKLMGLDSSLQVAVMGMLESPPEEPRMTKLAPLMKALLPEVYVAIRKTCTENTDSSIWTKDAEAIVHEIAPYELDRQVARDIIQGVMTYYLAIELNEADKLKEWAMGGSLK